MKEERTMKRMKKSMAYRYYGHEEDEKGEAMSVYRPRPEARAYDLQNRKRQQAKRKEIKMEG